MAERRYEARYQLDRTAANSPVDPVFELKAAGDLDTYEPGRLLFGNRTSIIVDPPDGRVPTLTATAQRRLAAQTERVKTHYAENPENLPGRRALSRGREFIVAANACPSFTTTRCGLCRRATTSCF